MDFSNKYGPILSLFGEVKAPVFENACIQIWRANSVSTLIFCSTIFQSTISDKSCLILLHWNLNQRGVFFLFPSFTTALLLHKYRNNLSQSVLVKILLFFGCFKQFHSFFKKHDTIQTVLWIKYVVSLKTEGLDLQLMLHIPQRSTWRTTSSGMTL